MAVAGLAIALVTACVHLVALLLALRLALRAVRGGLEDQAGQTRRQW